MKKKTNIGFCTIFLIIVTLLQSCDSGDIYPKEEEYEKVYVSVSGSFTFKGINAFPENYKVLFVTYRNETDNEPLSYKEIAKPGNDGIINVSFPTLPEGTKGIGIWLTEKTNNKKIIAFYNKNFEETPTEDIILPSQDINLLIYNRVQKQVFNQCIACHGGGASAASGMYLTEGKSYDNIVNVASSHNAAKMRISPYSTLNSYLMDVLHGQELIAVHSGLSSLKDEDITLVEEWVREGAKKE